jgi:hypothetical protein
MPFPRLLARVAFAIPCAIPLAAQETGGLHPCADSALYAPDGDFWTDASWEEAGDDACDPEESLLFSSAPGESAAKDKPSNRASFSVARNAGGEARSTLRQQAQANGWSHRVEVREDTLTRRRLGWQGAGWRWTAGDLDDPDLPIWPQGLPRRTLPRGWRRAERRGDAGYDVSSPYPQGVAAGVFRPRWKAWTAHVRNPVETGDEPPWSPAWRLRHASTGISLSLPGSSPWTLSGQFTETRITRGDADSVTEQQWAGGAASPEGDLKVVGAVSENAPGKNGWALAAGWRHRFENAAELDLTARQRDAAWASSWDPAVTEPDDARDSGDAGWGAGEFRLAGSLPWDRAALAAETWRAWNPAAGTGRAGIRGRATWRGEGARVELSGTRRNARAASGSVSLYRYLEIETRLEENPGFRLAAFRAWNARGPTRTGLFAGLEPAWSTLRAKSGLRIETDAEDRVRAQASLGARWAFARGWDLDAAASAPCYPRWDTKEARWRMTVNYAVTGRSRPD